MKDYGVFANIVAVAGSLASAVAAIRLAFMKRSKWQPPEEALPAIASRFASLLAMIVLALLFVFAPRLGSGWMALITIALLAIAAASLVIAIRTNITFSFYYPKLNEEKSRKLGGDVLTEEAARIKRQHHRTEQLMFEDARGDKDLVWTKDSQASVNVRSTLSFIGLIGFGTCSLASAAILVVLFTATPSPTNTSPTPPLTSSTNLPHSQK